MGWVGYVERNVWCVNLKGRSSRRYEENVIMNINKMVDVNQTVLTPDGYQWRVLVNTVMNYRV